MEGLAWRGCFHVSVESGKSLAEAQRELAETWSFRCYGDALRSWIATVAIVEVEYVGEWEEYANELTARDYLVELAALCPSFAPTIESEVLIWDQRFRAATVQQDKPWLRSSPGDGRWWMYRRPVRWRQPAREELQRWGYTLADPPETAP